MPMQNSLPIIVLLAFTACTARPYDGELIASHPTTVIPQVWGFTTVASGSVQVQARNTSGTFVTVTTVTAASSGWSWNDTTWYQWSISNLNLPAAYWTDKPGGCGRRATLRAKFGDYYGISLKEPWGECFDFSMTTADFVDTCSSEDSPDIVIETCGALCC
jgi:hypothetical protein